MTQLITPFDLDTFMSGFVVGAVAVFLCLITFLIGRDSAKPKEGRNGR